MVTRNGVGQCNELVKQMDEFLCESSEEDADAIGKLMCEAYKYASDRCYEWHMNRHSLFPNQGTPLFAFNLDGGWKVGDNYLQTH